MFTMFWCFAAVFVVAWVVIIYYSFRILKAYAVYRKKLRAWVKYCGCVPSREVDFNDETYKRLWNDAHEAYLAFRKVYSKVLSK